MEQVKYESVNEINLPDDVDLCRELVIKLEADIEDIINQLHLANASGKSPNGASKDSPEFFSWKHKAKKALTIKKTKAKRINSQIKKLNREQSASNKVAGAKWRRKYSNQKDRADRLQEQVNALEGEVEDLRETLHAIAQIVVEKPAPFTNRVVEIIYSTLDL